MPFSPATPDSQVAGVTAIAGLADAMTERPFVKLVRGAAATTVSLGSTRLAVGRFLCACRTRCAGRVVQGRAFSGNFLGSLDGCSAWMRAEVRKLHRDSDVPSGLRGQPATLAPSRKRFWASLSGSWAAMSRPHPAPEAVRRTNLRKSETSRSAPCATLGAEERGSDA